MSGFTKRDKTTCDSEIFFSKPDKWFKIWFYIVGEVCWKDYKQRKRGENRFSYEKIMRATGASKEQVYKMLKWTRERRMIDVSKTTRGMSIKVLNYAKYQDIKNDTDDDETTTRRQRDDTETDTIEEEVKKKEIKNNNFVIEKKPPKPKRVGPTRQQKEAIIQEIKRKVEAYGMVYDAQQDKDFAGHILSKKMTEVAQKYGYASPLSFLLSVIDMSMQETGGRLDKRWRYKVNGPKIVYQKYAEICADYQNSMNGKDEGIKKF